MHTIDNGTWMAMAITPVPSYNAKMMVANAFEMRDEDWDPEEIDLYYVTCVFTSH